MKKALKQLKMLEKYSKSPRLAAEFWSNDFETLISIILSARTRDETTIRVAEKLFKKYPNAKKLSNADIKDVEGIIKPVNFYKNKSKAIIKCSKQINDNYNGKVPHEIEELLKLSGVGRKTANVFLSEKGKNAIGVDTHVSYISQYLRWTNNKNPVKIEGDLEKIFPENKWKYVNPTLVRFGKTYTSRKQKNKILDEIKKKSMLI